MSKSLNNALNLGASAADIKTAVKKMYTDPNHLKVSDPGTVEGNVVFAYLDAFDPDTQAVEELKAAYRRGGLGDGIVKERLENILHELLAPIRERREHYSKDKGEVLRTLKAGTEKARTVAGATVAELKRALGLVYF